MPVQQRLLLILAQHPQQILSRQFLHQQLWVDHSPPPSSAKALSLAVHRLRQTFADGPLGKDVVKAVYGKGYCLDIPAQSIIHISPQSQSVESMPKSAPSESTSSSNARLAQLYYLEANDHWPRRDPQELDRRHRLLQKSIATDPTFMQAGFDLCYYSLLQCLWGMRSSASVLAEIQPCLTRLDSLPSPAPAWSAIRAEVMTMLLWQPHASARRYGSWLTRSIPAGPPLYSWSRHLIFSGQPHLAVEALKENIHQDLCQGWLVLSLAHAALGDVEAAIQAADRQLHLDPKLVGSRLFLAMFLALRGQGEAATRMVCSTDILDRPFQGSLALVCYSLAHGPMRHKAHLLLDEALAVIKLDPAKAGGIGYWGLAALALDRSRDAFYLLALCVRRRCYSAPVLAAMPFLKPFRKETAYRNYQEQMQTTFSFPSRTA